MRRVRTCAAAAAWLFISLLTSACSLPEAGTPPVVASPPPTPALATAALPQRPLYPPSPDEAHAELVRWFSAAGYQGFQIRALADHARAESGFRPCAAGPAGLRYTFQWGGTRLQRLQQFARTPGCPQLHTQLAFADKELRNESRYWCFWQATTEATAYAALRRGFGGGSC